MPIYEYRCQKCKKKSSLLLRTWDEEASPVCPHCGSTELQRIFSRFAMVRSEEDRMERLADPSGWGSIDENDPRSIMRWAKRMGREMGEEMGEDFDQMVEEEFDKEYSADNAAADNDADTEE